MTTEALMILTLVCVDTLEDRVWELRLPRMEDCVEAQLPLPPENSLLIAECYDDF